MSRFGRLRATARAATYTFARRRTAMVFTFLFPVLIVVVFGVLVRTGPAAGGVFGQPPAYYLPGYLATVVVFTPISRVGSTVARHREGRRFEKLATTPLRRWEWLTAHLAVNAGIVVIASLLLTVLVVLLTGASVTASPWVLAFVLGGVGVFAGLGAILGRMARTQDGVIAAANTIAFPLLFLSETFIPPTLLPGWFRPLMAVSPVTYFARGVRAVATGGGGPVPLEALGLLTTLAVLTLAGGAAMLPVTE